MILRFSKEPSKVLHNLFVARNARNEEVGFIHRPRSTKSEKSAWRAYWGIGEAAEFLGHAWDKKTAMDLVKLKLDGQKLMW